MSKSIDYVVILSELKERKENLIDEIKGLDLVIKNIQNLVEKNSSSKAVIREAYTNQDLSNVSAYEGCIIILKENGNAMTTKELLEELANRGKKSSAGNPLTSLYSSLYKATDKRVEKDESGRWRLTAWQ